MWGKDNVIQVPGPRRCICDGFPTTVCRGNLAYPHVFHVDNLFAQISSGVSMMNELNSSLSIRTSLNKFHG